MSDTLPMALGIAASPFPIIPAILLLFTPRARLTSISFLVGWLLGIGLATTAFTLLAEYVDSGADTPTWASWARIVLGAVLVVYGVRSWLTREADSELPGWMQSIQDATPVSALRLALLLSVANPKILLFAAAAGLAIGDEDLSTAGAARAIVLFTAVAAVSVAVPVLLYAVLGERMLAPLGVAKDWLQDNNSTVMAVVITVIGLVLVSKGISAL